MQVSETEKEEKSSLEALNFKEIQSSINQEESSTGFMNVLQNTSFLILWLGQVFSQLADKIYLVLIIAIISSNFQASGESISGWVSLVMIAFTIPAVLFGSLAGVYVDRWSKKVVLVVSNLLRGILVLMIPFCLSINNIEKGFFTLPRAFWLLLLITFLVSTLTQFFAPAEQATIPLIVKKKDLLAANSVYTTTMMAMLIIGFAIGDPLLVLVGKWGKIVSFNYGQELLVGVSYGLAGLILIILNTQEKNRQKQTKENHPFEDIKEGLRYLNENHRVRNALFQLVILFSIFAALAVLAVRLAETIPGMEASQFGYLLAATGLGIAIGATIVTHQGKITAHAKLSFWGSMGMAGALSGLSVATNNLILALTMTIILGIFAAFVGVPMQTTIQAETPPQMRGKVFGLQNNAVNIALSLPLALAGVAETYFGLRIVLIILALLAVFASALTSLITSKYGN
ncbi:MAG: MFS transporter [Cyanobacteria bacterium]|nr:MFS transporter [Cyanobacteria bacterium CG_2015-16_32_12]NCO78880.1 MFS transporter [Cyanobacteria bacterium CG_2015-22_32_23]NCQ04507.1 MFS transporter [Cyanobacteria bacterium CG_2015-09_32_10]NCQ40679.1 MFS transporter [Cyanobacteria bacterium CG_2015-04_32_10]NCS85802.1 MFS transporter [Cyanobacteria bacterium CG_2015-02_32_10]